MSEQPTAPDTLAIRRDTTTMQNECDALAVTTDGQLLEAGEFLKLLRRIKNRIAETFDGPVKAAHAAHKAIVAARNEHEKPVTACEEIVKGKMSGYTAEQERLRLAEESRLRVEARKAEEARVVEQAAQLEREGRADEAEALIERPIDTPPVVLAKTTPKVKGVTTRKIWKYRIVNESLVPRQYMIVNESALGSMARSLGAQAKVAGVEFYSEDSVAVTA